MLRLYVALMLAGFSSGVSAQTTGTGRGLATINGQTGQRQTRDQAEADGIGVTGRVDGRIQNRVQSRIRNRVDRFYNPQADAASSFAIAADQVRDAARRRR